MSHIARELQMLFYLENHRNRYVKISEIADIFELDNRQIRRYKDDLSTMFDIESKSGSEGGYKLLEPFDKALMIPDNIMLALNVSIKNNESLLKALKELPVISRIDNAIGGDNIITDKQMNNLVDLVNAIRNHKTITFDYMDRNGNPMQLDLNPYKILYENHTYYLCGDYKGNYNHYDVDCITNIKINDSFDPIDEMINKSKESSNYGIKNDNNQTTLILQYDNDSILERITRLFNYKGLVDKNKKTYTVTSNSENELYYPLFSLGTTHVKILNEDFKNKYIKYLEGQLNALKR